MRKVMKETERCPKCKTELEHIQIHKKSRETVSIEDVFGCPKCKNEIPRRKAVITNDLLPERKKAIKILETISEYMGDEDIFDCKKEGDTKWYDLEDMVTEIIKRKG